MAQYKYLRANPLPFTLPNGAEHILVQGKIFELPSNNEYIRGLEEQGYLERVPDAKPAPAPKKKQQRSSSKMS